MFEGDKKEPKTTQMVKFIMSIVYAIEPDSFAISQLRRLLEETLSRFLLFLPFFPKEF